MQSSGIGIIDIIIIVAYLAFIIWWGLRNGKSGSAGSYFLAGRGTPWFIVGLSLFAASISSTTLIGQTGDAYATGIAVFNYNLTGVWVLVFFAVFLLPLYLKSKIFTIPEFLERRFDSRSRYYFSAISIIGNIFLDAAGALYSAALILKLLFPAVELWVFVVIFAVIAASYTIPGGLSAAINTDLIQAVVLLVGSIVMMIICYAKGGGAYFASLMENGDIAARLIRPLSDSSTPWLGLLVGMPVLGIYFWANNQTLVQRVLSAKSVNQGRIGVMHFLFIVPILLIFSMLVIWLVSLATGKPAPEKLVDTTFSAADFKAETRELKGIGWWKNYRVLGAGLILMSLILLFIFR